MSNNESRFSLDTSVTLDELLSESEQYAINTDVAGNNVAEGNTPDNVVYREEPTPAQQEEYVSPPREPEFLRKPEPLRDPEPVVSEPVKEPDLEAAREHEPLKEPEPKREPETEPLREPEPVRDEPRETLTLRSEDDYIRDYNKIINILDYYRELKNEDKENMQRFFNRNSLVNNDGELVYRVINFENDTRTAIRHLSEAKEQDLAERSFFIMELTDKEKVLISNLLRVFQLETLEGLNAGSRDHSLKIVRAVDKIEEEHTTFLNMIEGLLKAAE